MNDSPTTGKFSADPHARLDSKRAIRLIVPLLVFLLPLVLYLRTMCPSIYPGDGPELTAAAWCLGVPHPTGYPLFMLLGYLFQHAGLGSPAFAMNFMAALFGALACLGVYRMQRELWRIALGRRRAGALAFRCASAALALLMGAGATWWDESTQGENYTLMLVFISFGWAIALRLIRHPSRRGLWVLGFWSGLAFLHHQLYIVTFPVALAGFVAWWRHLSRADRSTAVRRFIQSFTVAAVLFVLPLTLYAYIPLRARALPAINWGNPRGIQGIIWDLTGKQYTGTRILGLPDGSRMAASDIPAHVQMRLKEVAQWTGRQYMPDDPQRPYRGPIFALLVCLFAGLGSVCLWRRSPLAASGVLLGIALNVVLVIIYTIKDIETYQMPLWLFVGNLAVLGPVAVENFFPDRFPDAATAERHWRKRAWGAAIVVAALAVYGGIGWFPPARGINKATFTRTYDYANTMMRILPPNAVVFTTGDYDIFPLWYIQVCEGRRPDIAVIGSNFVFNGWYAAMLQANLPKGVSVYVGDQPPTTKERWLTAFVGGMLAPAVQTRRPVFLTFPDDDIMSLYQTKPYVVPSPYPVSLSALGMANTISPDKMPIYEITDPNDYSRIARLRFAEEFPAGSMRLISGRR